MGRRAAGCSERPAVRRRPPRPAYLAALCGLAGPRHLDADFELVRETFHRFAEQQVRPARRARPPDQRRHPRGDHRRPGRARGFGLSVPEEYGGFATGGESDYLGMVVATEELSWGSLGIGGSLITRPEILTRALVHGGTEEQKHRVAPPAGLRPAHGRGGRDRAGLRLRRGRHRHLGHPGRGRLAHQRGQDLVHLRRPGRRAHAAGPHRPRPGPGPPGLSLFVVEKPRGDGHGFVFAQDRRRAGAAGRPAGGPAHRHARLPGHALLRAGLRELVRPRRQPGRRGRRPGPGLLPPDAGLRERAAADGGPGPRGDAGGLRGGP